MKLFYCFLILLIASSVFAAEEHHHHHDMENVGTVHFATSCNAAAQMQFDYSVAFLHSFGYEEAVNSFGEVLKKDPDCAMAYWGIAMTYYHPIWAPPNQSELEKGSDAIQKAKTIGKPSERELQFINALTTFYKDADKTPHIERAKAYATEMEKIYRQYPNDNEAAVFYALAIRGTADPKDRTYSIQKQSAAILNEVLKKEPEHPGVAHYLIHDYDYPELAELALPAARIYSKIAPDAPHALHMPSHIFTRLGLWQESVDSNLASAAAAKKRAMRLHPNAAAFDGLHAMDYLMYAYLQLGENEKALQVLKEAQNIGAVDNQQFAAAYSLAAIPARYALERNQWKEAAQLQPSYSWFDWKSFPWAEAITYFARGIGAVRSGNIDQAKRDLERLKVLHDLVKVPPGTYDWAEQVDIQQKSLAAWITFAEGKQEQALGLMREAADEDDHADKSPVTPGSVLPARELLADMYMEMKKPALAASEYESVLKYAPKRLRAQKGVETAQKLIAQK